MADVPKRVAAAQARFEERDDIKVPRRFSPLAKWRAGAALAVLAERFLDGDNLALLDAVMVCCMHGMALPDWVVSAFCEVGWNFGGSCDPWAEIFDGRRRGSRRGSPGGLKAKIWELAMAERKKGTGIDRALFAVIVKEHRLGVSASKAEKLYYEFCHAAGIKLDARKRRLPRK